MTGARFKNGDRVLVTGGGSHLEGRVATVIGEDSRGGVRIKCNVKLPAVSDDWEHDYWCVHEGELELTDVVTELAELTRE